MSTEEKKAPAAKQLYTPPPDTWLDMLLNGVSNTVEYAWPTPQTREELLKENTRKLQKIVRVLDRGMLEKDAQIDRSRKFTEIHMRKNDADTARHHATAMVRSTRDKKHMLMAKGRVEQSIQNISSANNTQQMASSMAQTTRILWTMNNAVSLPALEQIMRENNLQMETTASKQKTMDETLDLMDKVDEGAVTAEVEAIMQQIALGVKEKAPAAPVAPLRNVAVARQAPAAAAAAVAANKMPTQPAPKGGLFINDAINNPDGTVPIKHESDEEDEWIKAAEKRLNNLIGKQ